MAATGAAHHEASDDDRPTAAPRAGRPTPATTETGPAGTGPAEQTSDRTSAASDDATTAPSDPSAPPTEAGPAPRERPTEPIARVPRVMEAMRAIGTDLELRYTLDRITKTAAELTGARYSVLAVRDPARDGLADVITHGVPEGLRRRAGAAADEDDGLIGALLRHPEELRSVEPTSGSGTVELSTGQSITGPHLAVPIRVRGQPFGNLYVVEKRGGGDFGEADLFMLRVLGTEAGIAIGNARLYETTRQRERWIDGSVAVTTALLSGGGAESALSVVAEQARRLAASAAGIVLLPTDDGGLEIVAAAAADRTELLGTRVAPDSPVVGELLAGVPIFVADSATDPRMTADVRRQYGPSMMLPLHSGDRVLGILSTPRARNGRPFTATERTLATQFAAQAALALVLAEAQRDRERLAVYEDRDRIARDLHDLVIQRLFATGMMLESAHRKAPLPAVREKLGKAVDELDATIQEIRTTIFALQQEPTTSPPGLRTRVLREIGAAAVSLGFQPSANFVGPVDAQVGELTSRNLIAALRESLSNAFRHAGASRMEVTVDTTARLPDGRKAVRLTVSDDGVGIPEDGRRSGLRNLSRRAEALGGSSRYGPGVGQDGGGTSVVWEAPL